MPCPRRLQPTIDAAWEIARELRPRTPPAALRDAVAHVIDELDAGRLRVAERVNGEWVTHQWIKKAVLLSFRLADNAPMAFAGDGDGAAPLQFYDKVPTKFAGYTPSAIRGGGRARGAARDGAPRRVHRAATSC